MEFEKVLTVRLFVVLSLLYYTGVLGLLGSTALLLCFFYLLLLVSVASFAFHFVKSRGKLQPLDILLVLYSFILPVVCAIRSKIVFDQPFMMGVAAMRYGLLILFGYFFLVHNYSYKLLLKQINMINLVIACVATVLFFVFDVDNIKIHSFLVSTNSIEVAVREDLIKGAKLTECSRLMMVSYIYYLVAFLRNPGNRKTLLIFAVFMLYLIFVHKGRQPLAVLSIVFVIVWFRTGHFSLKKLAVILVPLCLLLGLAISGSSVLTSFSSILSFTDTEDSSTFARIESVLSVWPYIRKYPLLGFGNLSVHYMDQGFHSIFGSKFFLSDIGVVGAMAQGGIVLLVLYGLLYASVFTINARVFRDESFSLLIRYISIAFILQLFFMSDQLFLDNCLVFALVFYPLYGNHHIRLSGHPFRHALLP